MQHHTKQKCCMLSYIKVAKAKTAILLLASGIRSSSRCDTKNQIAEPKSIHRIHTAHNTERLVRRLATVSTESLETVISFAASYQTS